MVIYIGAGLFDIWNTSARGSVSQFGDVNVNPLSVPASIGKAWYSNNITFLKLMTTSVLKAGMKSPSLQRLTLSSPMNQSGEGTIFVITDIWEIIVETMIVISHRQTMLWLASTKTLVEVFPTPCTIGGAKMASKKLRLLDAWSKTWGEQSLRPQYDEFLFWLYKRTFFYSWIFSWLWVYSLEWDDEDN